ncbi:MAG: hemolysin family protein [Pelagibacteraceae bacterium]
MSKKENLNIISKILKKVPFFDSSQNIRESIKDVIDDRSNAKNGFDLSSKEKSILTNILSINQLKASDVMIPRASIISVSHQSNYDELIKIIENESHSRMPVFRKDLDDVLGMVHIKDIIKYAGEKKTKFNIIDVVKEVLFVPPTMPVLNLLLKMQATKLHMALVIDEHGGTDGLITIEDVIEEIVGEIEDEHDKDDNFSFKCIDTNIFEAKADMTLEDFNKQSNLNLHKEDVDTLGGYVFSIINRVPNKGEIIKSDELFIFEVLDADPRKIKKLKISKKF